MGSRQWYRLALHRARKTSAERLYRKLQRQVTALSADCCAIACRVIDEWLNETLFGALGNVRETLEEWREDYNWRRPHSALVNLTPMEFLQRKETDKMAA
jgi:transposase InsO family protein